MDDAITLSLALSLQLEEISELLNAQKGKHPAGQGGDMEFALALYEDELRQSQENVNDLQIALNLNQALQADAAILDSVLEEEEQASLDRNIAMRLDVDAPENKTPSKYQTKTLAGPSNAAASSEKPFDQMCEDFALRMKKALDAISTVECAACLEIIPKESAVGIPCFHYYCIPCLGNIYSLSLKGDTSFPPKCCRNPLPFDSISKFLPRDIARQANRRILELRDPNPITCANPNCGAYIPPANADGSGRSSVGLDYVNCLRCNYRTCSTCKKPAHANGECPEDRETQSVLEMSKIEGWRRCSKCKAMVELESGCNHITCKCTAQFCYVCGMKWKTCKCPTWSEEMIMKKTVRNRFR